MNVIHSGVSITEKVMKVVLRVLLLGRGGDSVGRALVFKLVGCGSSPVTATLCPEARH